MPGSLLRMFGLRKSRRKERPEVTGFTELAEPNGFDGRVSSDGPMVVTAPNGMRFDDRCVCDNRSPYIGSERRDNGSVVETEWWCANCYAVVEVRKHKPLFPPYETPNRLLSL